ncbi:SDR family oxidoreductase [Cohaesibacter sp. CAU 1516]|uniref:SDR family NAD(P)-dependent oxidoreductase n=1 Tax=Cohaesibacter sp. CAU 1516 TaxID=2576038 RepID=UPI0010FD47A2|nr:SDR family NAD(P)-dependent oxidoreductase [Cohaesibacter sp. CAU 1516]TLP48513.1 SDR family oxidoreductase [Cohaesibacter sp. CAU 1516]
MIDLKGKSALITGSSKGIGLAIARALHQAGCHVLLNGRTEAPLKQACDSLGAERCSYVVGDVSDPAEAQRIADAARALFGSLDILVCNVGSGASVPPGQETAAEWQRVFATNLWSTTNMVESCRDLITRQTGSILCISSICGNETIPGAPVTYSTAKAALNAFVKGIARPLGKDGIRINAIAPGNILFDGSVWQRKLDENEEAVDQMLQKDVALARLGTPEEIANLTLWLTSDQATFATGQIWTLDGGQTRR